jgi:hypothetical protein
LHFPAKRFRCAIDRDRKKVGEVSSRPALTLSAAPDFLNFHPFHFLINDRALTHNKCVRHEVALVTVMAELRKIVYTTSAIESLNMSLRKIIKNRAAFPSEEAAYKLLYLALQNIAQKWAMPMLDWVRILNQLAILFEGRLPQPLSLTQNF